MLAKYLYVKSLLTAGRVGEGGFQRIPAASAPSHEAEAWLWSPHCSSPAVSRAEPLHCSGPAASSVQGVGAPAGCWENSVWYHLPSQKLSQRSRGLTDLRETSMARNTFQMGVCPARRGTSEQRPGEQLFKGMLLGEQRGGAPCSRYSR